MIGNYTHCSMFTKSIGTFKPNDDANSYIGKKNQLEFVEEVMVIAKDTEYGLGGYVYTKDKSKFNHIVEK